VLDKITNLHGDGGREKKDNHLPTSLFPSSDSKSHPLLKKGKKKSKK